MFFRWALYLYNLSQKKLVCQYSFVQTVFLHLFFNSSELEFWKYMQVLVVVFGDQY